MRAAALDGSCGSTPTLAEAHVARGWVHARELEWARGGARRSARPSAAIPKLLGAYTGIVRFGPDSRSGRPRRRRAASSRGDGRVDPLATPTRLTLGPSAAVMRTGQPTPSLCSSRRGEHRFGPAAGGPVILGPRRWRRSLGALAEAVPLARAAAPAARRSGRRAGALGGLGVRRARAPGRRRGAGRQKRSPAVPARHHQRRPRAGRTHVQRSRGDGRARAAAAAAAAARTRAWSATGGTRASATVQRLRLDGGQVVSVDHRAAACL